MSRLAEAALVDQDNRLVGILTRDDLLRVSTEIEGL
jgi:Mg/Co/Ni transporter MgtE